MTTGKKDIDWTAAARASLNPYGSISLLASHVGRILDRKPRHADPHEYWCKRDGTIKCGMDTVWKTGGDKVIEYCHNELEKTKQLDQ